MTPKEKAEEFFVNYLDIVSATDGRYNIEGIAKQCALIAVDEILNLLDGIYEVKIENYYLEVKDEIEKL